MLSRINIAPEEAQWRALAFVAKAWELPLSDQEWLVVLTTRLIGARLIGESWYVVEIGVKGLPNKWAVQVDDTGACDPDYTFLCPIATLEDSEVELFPPAITNRLRAKRHTLASTRAVRGA